MRLLNFGWAAIDYADSLPFLYSSHRQAASPFDSCLISIIWRVSSSARGLCQGRVRQVKTNPTHTHTHTQIHTPTHWDFGRKLFDFQLNFESTTEETCHHQQHQLHSALHSATRDNFISRFVFSLRFLISFHFVVVVVWCAGGREGESWQLSSQTEITWISKGMYGNELMPSDPTTTWLGLGLGLGPHSPLSLGSEAGAVATCSLSCDWGVLRERASSM